MGKQKNIKNRKTDSSLPGKRSLSGRFFSWFGITAAKMCAQINYIGQENIPARSPYVIAPNHQTYVDGLLVGKGLSKDHFEKFSALIGADLKSKHGLMGKLIVPVSRGVEVERYGNPVRGLVMARRACNAGNILMVHPEGTRTHDGTLGPLQNGAAYIAKTSKVPLIPVYIEGGFEVFSRHDKWPRFRNPKTGKKFIINIIFGKALLPENYSSPDEMTDALEDWLLERENEYLIKNEGLLRDLPKGVLQKRIKKKKHRRIKKKTAKSEI
ncbi:MAG: lysophospholipid acyltransferase family protein [Saccharofermentanales bacterium]|jgi:1-acyl-sn-glycerol-3-phosphate acyltransferase